MCFIPVSRHLCDTFSSCFWTLVTSRTKWRGLGGGQGREGWECEMRRDEEGIWGRKDVDRGLGRDKSISWSRLKSDLLSIHKYRNLIFCTSQRMYDKGSVVKRDKLACHCINCSPPPPPLSLSPSLPPSSFPFPSCLSPLFPPTSPSFSYPSSFFCSREWDNNLRVPDQNGVSQAWYIVEMHLVGNPRHISKSMRTVPLRFLHNDKMHTCFIHMDIPNTSQSSLWNQILQLYVYEDCPLWTTVAKPSHFHLQASWSCLHLQLDDTLLCKGCA